MYSKYIVEVTYTKVRYKQQQKKLKISKKEEQMMRLDKKLYQIVSIVSIRKMSEPMCSL